MNEQSANSYDLIQAQLMLSSLVPKTGKTTKESPVPQVSLHNYSSLSDLYTPPKAQQAGIVEESTAPATSEESEPVLEEFDSWEGCLAWCMNTTRAEAAFVVDSQGFVIASRGRIPSHGFEGAGAEMICSIEQLERIAPDAGNILCLDVDFDKRKIVGFVALSESSPPYVVGLVSPDPLRVEMKHRMTQHIVNLLPNLD